MIIKKGDFIELDYTGKVSNEDIIYDTTIQSVAEDAGLLHKHEPGSNHDHSDQYSPITICVGERHLLPGLDAQIQGKGLGKHNFKLAPENAFGKKNPKLLQIIPMSQFKKQNIQPFVGLELNIDGKLGTIRSVSGGRTIVDFNHPLSGKEVEYDVDIKQIITDTKKQIEAIFKIIGVKPKSVVVKDKKSTVELEIDLPKEYMNILTKDITRLTGTECDIITKQKEAKTVKEDKVEDIKQ